VYNETMSENERGKLGSFLKESIDWTWDEFCKAEKDHSYTGYQGTVMSLIRKCSDGKLGAIKLAIDRVDGKIETPVKVEYPKVFILFPHAERAALTPPAPDSPTALLAPPADFDSLNEPAEPQEEQVKVATMNLRETVAKMADAPRTVPLMIHARKKEVEEAVRNEVDLGDGKSVPLVKSIIAANLIILANEKGKFEAITELFDQIDGKLVETIRILGEDMYLESYVLEAPYGAKKNKEGVYYLEAPQISDTWKQKFANK